MADDGSTPSVNTQRARRARSSNAAQIVVHVLRNRVEMTWARQRLDVRAFRRRPVGPRLLAALLAGAGLGFVAGAAPAAAAVQQTDERFVVTELPDSPVGRQMGWFLEASTRLPLGDAEWRAHLASRLLALPGISPARLDATLGRIIDARGARLQGVIISEPRALVALVTVRDGNELVVTVVVDRAGLIENVGIQPAASGPEVALPKPTGSAAVGTDRFQLVNRARG